MPHKIFALKIWTSGKSGVDLIESAKMNSAVDVVLVALPAASSGDSQHEASGIFKREESTSKSACQATQEQCKEAFGSISRMFMVMFVVLVMLMVIFIFIF